MRSSGNELLSVVENVLDFTRIEKGKLCVKTSNFNLHGWAEQLISNYSAMARDKDIGLTLEIGENVPTWISSDPMRLRQVLGNLVHNAIKFTESGGVHVSIEVVNQAPSYPITESDDSGA